MAVLRLLLPLRCLSLLLALSSWSLTASAVSVGVVDDFEDGTTQAWQIGGSATLAVRPKYVADGGPTGAGDGFLQLTSVGGSVPGSKLTAFNLVQWSGDYLAAGVGAISLDVNNLGGTDLILRLFIADAVTSPPNAAWTAGIAVPAGSGWLSIQFSLAPDDLVAATGTVAAALTGAAQLRIVHAPVAVVDLYFVPAIVASLGMDNVQAVPEPGSGLLLAASALALGATRAGLRRRAPRGRCRPGDAASR